MKKIALIIITFFVYVSCAQTDGKNVNASNPTYLPGDFGFRSLTANEKNYYSEEIKKFYDTNFLQKGFNGSILVAKNGQILFEDYHGIMNFETGEPITEHTPFHLASISKTFTGMTILKLWEEGRISLEDSLQKFFPALPYHNITIKMLLSHRSGLPNYLYFMDSVWNKKQKATNNDVVNFMIEHKPKINLPPGKAYNYSNTNFLLLASIIEKITHESYPQYMKDSVFIPLGLKDTYVFSAKDTLNYIPTLSVTKPFPMDHLDCTYGDKNIYSTVRDIFKWDSVLYTNTFLRKSTLQMAFQPQSNEHKTMHNYGLAWHLYFNGGDTIVYHNGKWHGSNTSFTRLIQDTATIIMLGNKLNNNIYHAKDMSYIFTGRTDTTKLSE